jgi:site-specific DNA-methyltransferase (adenine-specific)
MINLGLMSSHSNEWVTPDALFQELNSEFGFTLDVAATIENRKTEKYYDKNQDGLLQSWDTDGAVWCNPPYGREIGKWVKKAYEESKHNVVVMLIPARTDTSYWHDYIFPYAKEIRYLRGRIKFSGKKGAPFPSAVVIFNYKGEIK